MTAAATRTKRKDGSERLMIGKVILAEKPSRQKRRRKDWRFSLAMLRLREIEKLIRRRHRGPVPDPGDTDSRDDCLAYVRAAAFALSGQDMTAWCRMWAPWIAPADLAAIEKAAARRKRMLPPDGVAGLLGVTLEERTALKLNSIGACDVTKSEREKIAKERKREQDRARREAKRRAAGIKPRNSQRAASLAVAQPWLAEGISRATWFRRRRETPESRVPTGKKEARLSSLTVSSAPSHGEAGRVRGSGTESPAGFQGAAPHGKREGRRFKRSLPPERLRGAA